jgi:hypothetical protein
MRTAQFEVPADVMADFSEKLNDLQLENSIEGKTEDGDILVEVYYSKDETQAVDELEEHLENLIDELEEEEDQDEDEDEEDEDN